VIPSAQAILDHILARLTDLPIGGETGDENASVKRGMSIALRFLQVREEGGRHRVHSRMAAILELLGLLRHTEGVLSSQIVKLEETLEALLSDERVELAALETEIDRVLQALEDVATESNSPVGSPLSLDSIRAMASWNIRDLHSQIESTAPCKSMPSASKWESLHSDTWQQYLREHFDDPSLQVISFQPLAGGFGKETTLFAASGRNLNGEFVVRRDRAVNLVDNDCHRVSVEFELMSALHVRGIPTPKVLWLQNSHPLVPGSGFIVMEKARGISGGSVFGTGKQLDESTADMLGQIVAKIHTLPSMKELGDLTESIRPELWDVSLKECVRRYIAGWRELSKHSDHLPSPAIAAHFNWLLSNIPDGEGKPCLLHGDIGLHNMLLADGEVTALFDWEFSHIGDPAEDLAYIRNTMGSSLDWPRFMKSYTRNGGHEISAEKLRFFQVWGHVRNATGGFMVFGKFARGEIADPSMMLIPYELGPRFIEAAQAMIENDTSPSSVPHQSKH
jgi:aminoglycoside phosphotransferase (APT) family kinase protein